MTVPLANPSEFLPQLRHQLRGDVLTDHLSKGLYATDASIYQIEPVAVVCPKDEADVLTALRLAAHYRIAVIPRGGGTSLAGQTIGRALILDFTKYCDRILDINTAEGWARVQPGVVRDALNRAAAPHGLHFAPDPATTSRAALGGMIANNSSGTRSIRYGKTNDHVLGLRVALDDGTLLDLGPETPDSYAARAERPDRVGHVYRRVNELLVRHRDEIAARYPPTMRRVSGYALDNLLTGEAPDLTELFCGSEGTLGIILEAKVKLVPLPRQQAMCVAHFDDFIEALRAVATIVPHGPSAVEILDREVMQLTRNNRETARQTHFIDGDPAAVLLIEYSGESEADIVAQAEATRAALEAAGLGYAYPLFIEPAAIQDIWEVRQKGLGLLMSKPGKRRPLAFVEDTAVPLDVLGDYLADVLALCEREDTYAAAYAHASVGVIHVRPFLDLTIPEERAKFERIQEGTFRLVLQYGGSWSSEHGDGRVRSPFIERFFGSELYGAFREIKELFDPGYRLNPGNIIDAPPVLTDLRDDHAPRLAQALRAVYHYQNTGSFVDEVQLCTGIGACRKLEGGTMCPTFRATRMEEHSTRGRANALRLALSGELSDAGLTDERLKEALDLCISCKACKTECPSNVDMARLKSEVWQHRYRTVGVPLRDRLVRQSAQMAALSAGLFAPVVNWAQSTTPFRWILQRVAGIDARRVLPGYAKRIFAPRKNKMTRPPRATEKQVVLFADTYLNYHEPQVGVAAKKLLEACGYEVHVASVGCCQRPRISHGFLEVAKRDGAKTVEGLRPYLEAGLSVVCCEPSCASALQDDLPDLIDDQALAERLRTQVMMVDQFLYAEKTAGRLAVALRATDPLLIHGHCHQKALYGTAAMQALLTDDTSEVIEAGCCGMAGSFGYETEHYDLSVQIAEEKLLPALRKDTQSAVVACGFSCRHQISDLAGRKARHWVECVGVV